MNHANILQRSQPIVLMSLTTESFLPIKTAIMSTVDDYIKVHIKVTGRVQGVGFRFWTMRHARRLGLAGTVSNMSDYSVEALFYGTVDAVGEMIRLCDKGPAGARVTALKVFSRESIATCPEGFRIQH